MLVTSYHNNDHVIFHRMFYTATKEGRFTSNKAAGFKTYLNMNAKYLMVRHIGYNDLTLHLVFLRHNAAKFFLTY